MDLAKNWDTLFVAAAVFACCASFANVATEIGLGACEVAAAKSEVSGPMIVSKSQGQSHAPVRVAAAKYRLSSDMARPVL